MSSSGENQVTKNALATLLALLECVKWGSITITLPNVFSDTTWSTLLTKSFSCFNSTDHVSPTVTYNDVMAWRHFPYHGYFFLTKREYGSIATLSIAVFLIARFMGPTWGPSGTDRAQMGPMLAPWTLLSGMFSPMLAWKRSEKTAKLPFNRDTWTLRASLIWDWCMICRLCNDSSDVYYAKNEFIVRMTTYANKYK